MPGLYGSVLIHSDGVQRASANTATATRTNAAPMLSHTRRPSGARKLNRCGGSGVGALYRIEMPRSWPHARDY